MTEPAAAIEPQPQDATTTGPAGGGIRGGWPYPGRAARVACLSLILILLTAMPVVHIVSAGARKVGLIEAAGALGEIALGVASGVVVYALLGRRGLWIGMLLTAMALAAMFVAPPPTPWDWRTLPRVADEVLRWVPFLALLTLAALCAVPPELHEAAAVDRAGARLRLRTITLPLVAPLLLLAVAYRAATLLSGALPTPQPWAYAALVGAIVVGTAIANLVERTRSGR